MLEKVYHNAGPKEKTGYAVPRVARHHSRLDFGLTRAQLNLAQKAKNLSDPIVGEKISSQGPIFSLAFQAGAAS
jgi:hypothetical protein